MQRWSRRSRCCAAPGRGVCLFDFVGDWQQRVCAVPSLIDAVVAEAPVAFVTKVTLPVARVGICLARIAKHAFFQPVLRVILTHENVRRCCRLGQRRHWYAISMSSNYVGLFMIRGISTFRAITLVARPSSPSKAVPVLASFASTITAVAKIVTSVIAFRAVIVKLVLEVFFTAMLARDLRFGIQHGGH
jgi:hypothetical protein